MRVLILFLVAICVASLVLVDARRGGSRGRSRSSGTSRSRGSSCRSVTRYGSYRAVSRTNIIVVGYPRYYSRYHGTRHWNDDPKVCYNSKDRYLLDNKTLSENPPGYFICPFKRSDSDDFTYCCGVKDQQCCCNYWGDGNRTGGTVVSIIIGVILASCVILYFLRFYCKSKYGYHHKSTDVMSSENTDALMAGNAANPATTNENPMPQSNGDGKIGFEEMAPPNYDDAMRMPAA